jgi:hypothetical protein
VSHEDRWNAVLSGDELIRVASDTAAAATWAPSADTGRLNAPASSDSRSSHSHCLTAPTTLCHRKRGISSSALSTIRARLGGVPRMSSDVKWKRTPMLIHYRVCVLLERERFFHMGPTLTPPVLHCCVVLLLEIV